VYYEATDRGSILGVAIFPGIGLADSKRSEAVAAGALKMSAMKPS